jgi:glycosyltransferase involved in cell wall biosynthesis
MRVLHISSGNLYGGVETALVALARFRHHCPAMEPQFALSFEGRLSRELGETGVTVQQLGEVRTRKPWTIWAARKRLLELLSRERFDAAICHMFWPMAIFGKTARSNGATLAFWAHDAANGRHWLERWARQTPPDLVIANSRYTESTIPLVYPNAPGCIIPYPVCSSQDREAREERSRLRHELGAGGDSVVIIQVSRMEAWKGHRLHLEALSRLRDDQRWICWMVGGAQRPAEQDYQRSLQKAAVELGLEKRVQFLGQRSDVSRLLAAADIFCQPNLGPEPFGIVFIEAMAAGLPVVTTAQGGPKEIVDESCGILVAPENREQLAGALKALIESADLRARLGRSGPDRASTLCDPAGRIRDLYQALQGVAIENARHHPTHLEALHG